MTQIRIAFVGDSITHGTGDETLLGWPYRVGQAEVARGHDVTVYNLGVRADTSTLVASRWEAECRARLTPQFNCATVFAIGINDSAHEQRDDFAGRRVEIERSLSSVVAMLRSAGSFGPVLWVGPTPVVESMMPLDRLPGVVYDFRNDVIDRYNQAYARAAKDIAVPYLDLFTPLVDDNRWQAALCASDGLHPNAAGYAILATMVSVWNGWRRLFDAHDSA